MTANQTRTRRKAPSSPTISIEDLRHKAEHVRDIARDEVRRATHEDAARNIAVVAGAVLAVVSLAFYLGTRRGGRRLRRSR